MSNIYIGQLVSSDYLEHHGILGMKWGIRRFQNKDGSLTSAGKSRYGVKGEKKSKSEPETKRKGLSKGQKAAIALVTAGLAAYGGYKLAQSGKLDGFIKRGSTTYSSEQLKSMGVHTVEPSRTNITRVKINRTNSSGEDRLIRAIRSSDPERARNAKKAQDAFSSAIDTIIKDFRAGKIDRQEYATRLRAIGKAKQNNGKPRPTSFKDMTIDDLKKMDLW